MHKSDAIKLLLLLLLFSCNDNEADRRTETYEHVTIKPEVPVDEEKKTSTDERTMPTDSGIAVITGNEPFSDILSQGWENVDDVEALRNTRDDDPLEIPFRSFYFSHDGSFVKNPRNAMEYGTWKFDPEKKTISLRYGSGESPDTYKMIRLATDELTLINVGIQSTTHLVFSSLGAHFKNEKDDPFHISNCRWRIPPVARETDAAILQRLKANLHFFLLFYRRAILMKTETISFYGLPSPLKWYAGGIYLKKKGELEDKWMECFYNKEQAMKAYDIMDKVMEMRYKWPKDPSMDWVQKNEAVLQQIYNNLDLVK